MGASVLMSIGTRAMAANYAALQATGHNIANANTVGYSRQSVNLETAGGQFTGAGFFGKGVNVATVERAHSEFLTREAANSRAVAAGDAARSEQLTQLEKVFQLGEAGIGHAAGQLLNAFVDVANKPQDSSARQVVLSKASELADRVSQAGRQFDVLQAGVTADLKSSVSAVNMLASQVARLNQQISAVKGSGHPPNDLLDQRDQAVNDLSQYLQVSTVSADDGSISVFIGGGQKLVLGSVTTPLAALPDKFDPAKVQIGVLDSGVARSLSPDVFSAGSISGLLRFQNFDLPSARNQLGQMVTALAGRLNEQQALGLDLGQPPQSGAPLLSVGQPVVAPSSANAQSGGVAVASYIDSSGTRVSSVSLSIVDVTELQASDYELLADASGNGYTLTRLSDGHTQVVADGDVVDGMRVNIASPAPSPRDRFLLQPVAAAARNMARVLDDPKGIAAASPVSGSVGVDNKGTAGVGSLQAVSTTLDKTLHAAINFTDDSGNYDWQLLDAGNNVMSNGSATWQPGQPIQLNGWSLQLSGVPKGGDTLAVQSTLFPAGDNGNANALLSLRDAAIVGQQTLAGGGVVPGTTVTDAYANVLADIGVKVQSAATLADQSGTIATDAQSAAANRGGVNLDEEAARLIQFQQSYQAAAKMLQVAQSVFDTLLHTLGQ